MRSFLIGLLAALPALAANYPDPVQDDFLVHNFTFATGQTLPELRIHYTTIGKPFKDANGTVRNAVLIMPERSGGGMRAGHQDKLFEEGNAYLDREFPQLDHLINARVVD